MLEQGGVLLNFITQNIVEGQTYAFCVELAPITKETVSVILRYKRCRKKFSSSVVLQISRLRRERTLISYITRVTARNG